MAADKKKKKGKNKESGKGKENGSPVVSPQSSIVNLAAGWEQASLIQRKEILEELNRELKNQNISLKAKLKETKEENDVVVKVLKDKLEIAEETSLKSVLLSDDGEKRRKLEKAKYEDTIKAKEERIRVLENESMTYKMELVRSQKEQDKTNTTLQEMFKMEADFRRARRELEGTSMHLNLAQRQLVILRHLPDTAATVPVSNDATGDGMAYFLLEAVAQFPDLQMVQAESMALLTTVAVHDGPCTQLMERRAHIFVLHAMATHPQSLGVQIHGARLLHRIALRGGVPYQTELIELGAPQLLAKAMGNFALEVVNGLGNLEKGRRVQLSCGAALRMLLPLSSKEDSEPNVSSGVSDESNVREDRGSSKVIAIEISPDDRASRALSSTSKSVLPRVRNTIINDRKSIITTVIQASKSTPVLAGAGRQSKLYREVESPRSPRSRQTLLGLGPPKGGEMSTSPRCLDEDDGIVETALAWLKYAIVREDQRIEAAAAAAADILPSLSASTIVPSPVQSPISVGTISIRSSLASTTIDFDGAIPNLETSSFSHHGSGLASMAETTISLPPLGNTMLESHRNTGASTSMLHTRSFVSRHEGTSSRKPTQVSIPQMADVSQRTAEQVEQEIRKNLAAAPPTSAYDIVTFGLLQALIVRLCQREVKSATEFGHETTATELTLVRSSSALLIKLGKRSKGDPGVLTAVLRLLHTTLPPSSLGDVRIKHNQALVEAGLQELIKRGVRACKGDAELQALATSLLRSLGLNLVKASKKDVPTE